MLDISYSGTESLVGLTLPPSLKKFIFQGGTQGVNFSLESYIEGKVVNFLGSALVKCDNLEYIDLRNNYSCSLKGVVLPESVKEIILSRSDYVTYSSEEWAKITDKIPNVKITYT